ncbi:MAG: hypothetical protein ACREA7_08775 [Nitrosotalea sp.]
MYNRYLDRPVLVNAIFCWCGHLARDHSVQQPNRCSKCEECLYYRPRQSPNSSKSAYGKAMVLKARFDGVCKSCGLEIKTGEHDITRDGSGRWIHERCSFDKSKQS